MEHDPTDDPHDDMARTPDSVNFPWIKSNKWGNSRFDPSFYQSPEWKRFRKWYGGTHPRLCVKCGREAKYLDHIVPISEGGARLSEDNVQWLCTRCNSDKTNRDRMRANK